MKLFVLFSLVVLVVGKEPINVYNYHQIVGIPEAGRIQQAEAAKDFDGARIVGGAPAPSGQHPYMCGLVISLTSGETSVCGASLLSNTRALTAAHCWWDAFVQARSFTVVLGSDTLYSGGIRRVTNQVEMHANFNPYNAFSDLAMITMDWVEYTDKIQRIVPVTGSLLYTGQWATAVGYGKTSDTDVLTKNRVKNQVTVQVIQNASCQLFYGTWVVVGSTLCTDGNRGVGLCMGSTGGPLVIGSGNARQLIGVSSFYSLRGCQLGLPSGFVRVNSFPNWISARM